MGSSNPHRMPCWSKSPCKGCQERFAACSDKCPKDKRGEYGYKAWKTELYDVQNKRSAYNRLNRRILLDMKNSTGR